MTARCRCPELEVDAHVAHVGAGPIACSCCGKPLVLTCPGECGTQHIARSIGRAIARTVPKRRPRSAPRGEPIRCPRCHAALPKHTGRPTKACERCMTPEERKRLAYHRAQSERRRQRKAAPRPSRAA